MYLDNSHELAAALRMSRDLQRRAEDLQSRLAEATGQGADDQGLVRLCLGPGGTLSQVHIEPRAMRLASQDLAEAFRQAHAAATRDLQDRMAQIQQEILGSELLTGVLDGDPSPGSVLGEMRRTTEAGLDASLHEIERLRRQLG